MAKGSLYWGQATGKLGQTVLSVTNGQQIARVYQPNVKNPKSYPQQAQRARFATSVKFYKHATANFFPFAYEDKKKTESYYNAFMRHNVNVSMLTMKASYDNVNYPAIGNEYMLTAGRLAELAITRPTALATSEAKAEEAWKLAIPVNANSDTWGAVSQRLIDKGYLNGDIITITLISTDITAIDDEPSTPPQWELAQAVIDSSSSEQWSKPTIWKYRNQSNYLDMETYVVGSRSVTIPMYDNINERAIAGALSATISRVTSSGIQVANSYLVNNVAANNIYNASLQDAYVTAALKSWGGEVSQAVLKGAIAKKNV